MARQAKTQAVLDVAVAVLTEHHPMTVRQVFYQLVSRHALKNTPSRYTFLCDLLAKARKEGLVPWEWMEDRLRRPRSVRMWNGLADFAEVVRDSYRRDVWQTQPDYLEVWLEKDALSGIFEDILHPYGVTLNVGRGYDSWDSIRKAASRFGNGAGVTVLSFGDFDPSGEDMVRSLAKRFAFFECTPNIVRCALTQDDVHRYDLPPDFTKAADTRQAAFVAKYGDVAVELDALPIDVLQGRIVEEVEARMDLDALEDVRDAEEADRERLEAALRELGEV